MNMPPIINSVTALDVHQPDANMVYSIEAVSRIAHVPRRMIAVCCRYGLVSPIVTSESGAWYFKADAIRTLRQVEFLRTKRNLEMSAIKLVLDLMCEIERLRDEIRFLSSR